MMAPARLSVLPYYLSADGHREPVMVLLSFKQRLFSKLFVCVMIRKEKNVVLRAITI